MKIGIIARSDNTGLGYQTLELTKMLNPSKILLIDSHPFNNNLQHPEWYKDYNVIKTVRGFPKKLEVIEFLEGLDVVLSCETFYYPEFLHYARRRGIKTILQYNFEFLRNMANPSEDLPDILLAPSLWNIDQVEKMVDGRCKIMHLPPPTDPKLFENVKNNNLSRNHNRLLHVGGKLANKDRNGTQTILDMLQYSKADYELVIAAQNFPDFSSNDPRVTINKVNVKNREDMYDGFDAMILPRRYAGLCLPMNESLLSALPVFMPNISPNNKILPQEWLFHAEHIETFQTKSLVDVYAGNPKELASLIDNYIENKDKKIIKEKALQIGIDNFSVNELQQKYLDIISHI